MTTASPGLNTLHSDHINYLILRYLQEAGHEKAASAFYTDWHRAPDHRDPESYPFAQVVRRGELVHVIQDGLYHDELIARVKKNERKFRFTNTNARELREDGAVQRPSSSGAKRKGRPPAIQSQVEDFPTPAPKRQRRSEGEDVQQVNGDAMEVDAASASGDAAEEEGEAVSPAQVSEGEAVEVPTARYDSMDVSVQTDFKTGPKTSTVYWKVEREGASIFHSAFSPDATPENARTLLTVGESLCRFYQVPESDEGAKQVESVDEPSMLPDSVVTAFSWHPNGHTTVCAVETIRDLPDGPRHVEQQILSISRNGGTSRSFLLPPIIEPPGIILTLRYSPDGAYLLVSRTNIKRGLILIYDTSADTRRQEPVAWRMFERPVLDAVWDGKTPSSFFACGEHNLRELWQLNPTNFSTPENSSEIGDISTVGLSRQNDRSSPSPDSRWDRVVHDGCGTYAFASNEPGQLAFCTEKQGGGIEWCVTPATLLCPLTALAFQPGSRSARWLLATASDDGSCDFWDGEDCYYGGPWRSSVAFRLSDGPALALAWSKDGQHLAVAGHELVQIWDVDTLVEYHQDGWRAIVQDDYTPLVTWRPDTEASKPKAGEHQDDQPLSEPSLSWSADGERLAFTLDKQIAVMTFRPPLARAHELAPAENGNGHIDTNGHANAS